MDYLNCNNCGLPNEPGAAVCQRCGAALGQAAMSGSAAAAPQDPARTRFSATAAPESASAQPDVQAAAATIAQAAWTTVMKPLSQRGGEYPAARTMIQVLRILAVIVYALGLVAAVIYLFVGLLGAAQLGRMDFGMGVGAFFMTLAIVTGTVFFSWLFQILLRGGAEMLACQLRTELNTRSADYVQRHREIS